MSAWDCLHTATAPKPASVALPGRAARLQPGTKAGREGCLCPLLLPPVSCIALAKPSSRMSSVYGWFQVGFSRATRALSVVLFTYLQSLHGGSQQSGSRAMQTGTVLVSCITQLQVGCRTHLSFLWLLRRISMRNYFCVKPSDVQSTVQQNGATPPMRWTN